MSKKVTISDAAYNLLRAHMYDCQETNVEKTMDELFEVADQAWSMRMPQMEKPWIQFKKHLHP